MNKSVPVRLFEQIVCPFQLAGVECRFFDFPFSLATSARPSMTRSD